MRLALRALLPLAEVPGRGVDRRGDRVQQRLRHGPPRLRRDLRGLRPEVKVVRENRSGFRYQISTKRES